MKTYEGSCHCGKVHFTFQSEEITRGMRCNCSLCLRRGAVMSPHNTPADQFHLNGREFLTHYMFGDKMVNHYFCASCGISPFHDVVEDGRYRVNLGCVKGLDPLNMPIEIIDGKSF